MQRAGPTLVLSGEGRELSGLVAILSQPTGVGGRECKTFGYTCRTDVPKIFGREFNSRRLHQTELARPGANPMAPGDGIKPTSNSVPHFLITGSPS